MADDRVFDGRHERSRETARAYVLGRLSEAQRDAFEDHVAGCPECASQVLDLDSGFGRLVSALEEDVVESGLWSGLTRTVLRPEPAFAYLVAAAALLGIVVLRTAQAPRGPAPFPAGTTEVARIERPAIEVLGDATFRGGAGLAPLEIKTPAPGTRIELDLRADIDASDLRDTQAAFVVEISDAPGAPLHSSVVRGDRFGRGGTLRLSLDPEVLPRGRPLTVTIRLDKPGDPFHGKPLFRRELVLTP